MGSETNEHKIDNLKTLQLVIMNKSREFGTDNSAISPESISDNSEDAQNISNLIVGISVLSQP